MGVTVVGAVVVASLLIAISGQSEDASTLRADVDASETRAAEADRENEKLATDLTAAQQELASAEQTIAELEASMNAQEQAVLDAEDLAEALESQAAEDLAREKRLLREAEADRDRAQKLVAELTLAYSDDIGSARATLASQASSVACEWGTSQAVAGRASGLVTGTAALAAFASSNELATLRETPEIVTAIEVAETIDEDRYGLSVDDAESIAVACWQKEDAKLNAALYVHQNVFREAALDAACTHGASSAFSYFDETAVYQSWQLDRGDDAASEYEASIRDRFGSIEEFLAIPNADIESESARCEDIRDLISPKWDGTWNVGDEIMPGTWKAFDESDCYWARLSVNGDIRANHFGDALRISVKVSASDGQFEISNCYQFYFANP